MNEQPSTGDTTPIYNIKAVARLVGLLPVTIRAWERRYGLPVPSRGSQGYRLYSAYDLRTLAWLKAQVQTGLTIRQAADHLRDLREQGRDPALQPAFEAVQPVTLDHLNRRLLDTFYRFDSNAAQEILSKSFALFSIEQVLGEVISPAMVALGDGWARGDVPVSVEHFATQVILQRLLSMLASAGLPTHPGMIAAACLPGEAHEIGLISLAVLLRWRGWDVRYLGPNLSLDDLAPALAPFKPRLLLFSATHPESLPAIQKLPRLLAQFPTPAPIVVLGGQAFDQAQLPANFSAHLVRGSLGEVVQRIEQLALSA